MVNARLWFRESQARTEGLRGHQYWALRRNGSVSRFFILILKLIPSNITLGTYSRFENREKNGGSPYLIFFYGPRHEGTPIFILARVGAESRLFGAERKIKSTFKRWIRLEYTLKSIQ